MELAKQVTLSGHDELARRTVADDREAADHRAWNAARLPHDELGGAGELVGDGDLRRAKLVPRRVTLTAEVEERREAGDADRDVRRSLSPRPAERVADDHRNRPAGQLAEASANLARGSVGV